MCAFAQEPEIISISPAFMLAPNMWVIEWTSSPYEFYYIQINTNSLCIDGYVDFMGPIQGMSFRETTQCFFFNTSDQAFFRIRIDTSYWSSQPDTIELQGMVDR